MSELAPDSDRLVNLHRTFKNDRLRRSLTGCNRRAFAALLPACTAAWQSDLQAQGRKRAPGGGQSDKAHLSSLPEKRF